MKKISLKNVKNELTRSEMRSISGGSGDGKVGCCYLHNGSSPICGLSIGDAQTMYGFAKSHGLSGIGWCCASC